MRRLDPRASNREVARPTTSWFVAAILVLATAPLFGQAVDRGVRAHKAKATGRTTFLAAEPGGALPVLPSRGGQLPTASDFLRDLGPRFGVQDAASELSTPVVRTDALGFRHTSYPQVHKGVPVFSGVLRLHQNAAGQFTAANGKVHPVPGDLNTIPTVGRDAAVRTASAQIGAVNATVERSELVIVDPGWYGDPSAGVRLAYYVILSDLAAGVREAFFVDAHTGKALDQWNLLETVLDRQVIDDRIPGIVREEGDPPTGDFEADAAYDYAGDLYGYLARAFGRDSTNGAGATLVATVHLQGGACPNAFGGTSGTFYCDGLVTDDIVAHEFTHGLTGFTAQLVYQNQPGQLNESFSDVFGEVVDLLNGNASSAGAPGGTPWPAHGSGPGTDTPNNVRTTCEAPAYMTVNSPLSIAGDYPGQPAAFGPILTAVGVSADLVVSDPIRGCDDDEPFANAAEFAGKIVLMRRGDCFFTAKVVNAQDAGAAAVIIMNNNPSGPAPMGGSDPSIFIPSLGITEADGNLLIAAAQSATVNVTLRTNASPPVRWLVGEDSAGFGGAIRDMWMPSCFGHPDTANHPFQTCSALDNGGVHSGSGVPNHAFAILTDGKDFNGQNVSGIGLFKAAAVWFRALTVYLTPTSNFQDAYVAFNQSAADLVGTTIRDPRDGSDYGIFTAADAVEVNKALLAVEMNTEGLCGHSLNVLDATPPTLCDRTTLYADDFESGVNGWTVDHFGPFGPPTPYDWVQTADLPPGRVGTAWFAEDRSIGDCALEDESALHTLYSPVIALPPTLDSPQMMFTHLMETETFYDGGNVKISVNGGPWQFIPNSAFTHNRYNAELVLGGTSPIAGEDAWTGISYEGPTWGTSVVDLSRFVSGGESIQVRFDFGKDGCTGFLGWFVDDFEVFVCPPQLPALQPEPNGVAMNRFVSVVVPAGTAGQETALRVELTTLNHPRVCCTDASGVSCNTTTCDVDPHCTAPPFGTCAQSIAPGPGPDFASFEGKIRYANSLRSCSNVPWRSCQVDADCPAEADRCSDTGLKCPPDACATGVCGGAGTCVPTLRCPDEGLPFNTAYRCASLGCEPEYRDWATDLAAPGAGEPPVPGLLFITGDGIVPSSTFGVQLIAGAAVCGPTAITANTCSAASVALSVRTAKWGDVTGPGFIAPDGQSDVFDLPAVLNKLSGLATAHPSHPFPEYRVWLKHRDPAPDTHAISVSDLQDVQDAALLARPYFSDRPIDACSHD